MSEHITHTPNVKRLERSSQSRIVAGVCGGLGRYFDVNPTVFRLGLVVLTLLGGAGVLVYVAAVLVIPAEGAEASIAERVLAERRDHPWRLLALAFVGIALFVLLTHAGTWPSAGAGWVLVLIGSLVVLWSTRERRPRRIAIVLASVLAVLVATAAVATAVAFSWFDVSLGDGVGDRAYAPASAASVRHTYELGVGELRLDLTRVQPSRPLRVEAHVGVGQLHVIVPRDASVVVDSRVKAGSISAFDRHDDGTDVHVNLGGRGNLQVAARVGAGHIDVVRGG